MIIANRQSRSFECLERRYALSTVSFALNDIDRQDFGAVDGVVVADLDGDNDPDVVVTPRDRSALIWYENMNSRGLFGPGRELEYAGSINGVAHVGDMNGDGLQDVVVSTDLGLHYFRQITVESGMSYAVTRISSEAYPVEALVDFDSDGDVDVLTLADTNLRFHSNGGIGDFLDVVELREIDGSHFAFADIDSDGDLDVASADARSLRWYEQLPNSFIEHELIATGRERFFSVHLVDFDVDGNVDLLADSANKSVAVRNEDGAGTFSAPVSLPGSGHVGFFAADIDMDGDVDIAGANLGTGDLEWFEKLDNSFEFATGRFIATSSSLPTIVDIDGDGDLDAVAAAQSVIDMTRLDWFENIDGQATFSDTKVIYEPLTFRARIAVPADVDGDGDLDVVAGSDDMSSRIMWFENFSGSGDFGPPRLIDEGHSTGDLDKVGLRSLVTADIDGDGDLDIVSANYYGFDYPTKRIRWYPNNGDGTFANPRFVQEEDGRLFNVVAADLNGDDSIDLVGGDGTVYMNDGQGEFSVADRLFFSTRVASVDADGDDDIDIALASSQGIRIFENENGDFALVDLLDEEEARRGFLMAWEDITGDGIVDIMFTRGGSVILYRGREDGTFSIDEIIHYERGLVGFAAASDMDGDGDADVVILLETVSTTRPAVRSTDIVWHEQSDTGSFASGVRAGLGGNQNFVLTDVDADGDVDVLATRHDDGRIYWLEQRVTGDANNDGVFDSSDFVDVFIAGEYEDSVAKNSTFSEGDWNGDGDFDSSDIVFAFQAGTYVPFATPIEHIVSVDRRSVASSVTPLLAAAVESYFGDDLAKTAGAFRP